MNAPRKDLRLAPRIRQRVALRTRLRSLLLPIAGVRDRLPAGASGVALTFDDGPDPFHTPRVLDELAACGAKATFFCVGESIVAHREIVLRMVAEGHAVGSHSQHHHKSSVLPLRQRVAEFRAGRRSLESVLGGPAPLFRPPNGELDLRTALAIRIAGVRPWLWTIDPGDWRPGARTDGIVATVGRAAAGDVVVMHDGLRDPRAVEARDRMNTVSAIATIVDGLAARGLTTVTLPTSRASS